MDMSLYTYMGKSEKWSTRTKTKKSSKSSNFLRIFTNESLYFHNSVEPKHISLVLLKKFHWKLKKWTFCHF